MLEIGAVVHARRQHHHRRLQHARRRAGTQGVEQHVGIVGHGRHGVLAEQLGKQAHGHAAVLQHVGNARWHAQIVFQHVIDAVALFIGCAHDVDAGNIGIDIVGYLDAFHLWPVLAVAAHQAPSESVRRAPCPGHGRRRG